MPRRNNSGVARTVLGNGLRVVVAPDPSVAFAGVAVAYNVGFRSEPEGRTGFAHLFEHMMFQGSAHVSKAEHMRVVEAAGGVVNGHTLPDVTAYYEAVPAGALEVALFLEADRMASLAISEQNLANQVDVVKEEIKVNVLNQPYGGFPWIPLPALAYRRFPNAHNGYGDFADLERATVQDTADFFATYYTPSNAVLAVVGACSASEVFSLADQYFGRIRRRRRPKAGPWSEPPLEADRREVQASNLVPQPAFAVGLRLPDPVADLDNFLAYYLLAKILAAGDSSRLWARLVHRDHHATHVDCTLGVLGMESFFIRDPCLFQVLVYHPGTATTDALLEGIDDELAQLASDGPSSAEQARAVAGSAAEMWRGLGSILARAHIVASVETIHGRAELVTELPSLLASVRRGQVAEAAADLARQHRAIVELVPAGAA
ncbi:MAG TPA: pitrilysin family protein [Acidimicrobiales bacterium]|nr:pitrilysin family protein [Acidimicrobiales bacterium]